jgi:7-cyano-7-deazaguanine synthase
MSKCVVLLSGGLDSTVNFLVARQQREVVAAVTYDYGQKAALQEIRSARRLCDKYSVRHIVVTLPFFKEFTSTSLVSTNMNVPEKSDINLSSMDQSSETAAKVWVPNRNGIFLNIAAGYAEGLGADYVVPGFNLEEASTFPDNSQAFQDALNMSFTFSTRNKVSVWCFTQNMMKSEILRLGLQNGLEIGDLWPCYHGQEKLCMNCESCLRFARALEENGLTL